MTKKRNVEQIRQKNLEDNRLFLEKLRVNHIRDDFVSSARSILRKDGGDQTKKSTSRSHNKVEYNTRYSAKLKSGQIEPHVPKWQRKEERQQEKELQRQQEKEYQRQKREMKRQKIRRRKEMEREAKQREKQLQRQEKYRAIQLEQEEMLFEQELAKVERQLQFEELIHFKRDEQQGFCQWALFYQNPDEYRYNLRDTDDESIE